MKKYTAPELAIMKFAVEDVITASAENPNIGNETPED